MQVPAQITFRHLTHSGFVESAIRARIKKLEKTFPRITSLKVLVEPSHLSKKKGNLYHVRIELEIPGGEIIVRRDPHLNHAHEDIYVAIRDAFHAARRQLEDHVRKHYHQQVKTHFPSGHAKVSRLFPMEDCGILLTPEGREIYFHRNSVTHENYDRLEYGEEVRYVETEGEKGPQASTVVRIGKTGKHFSIPF